MACIVKEAKSGRLAYRLFWDGNRSWEGTGLAATDKRRAKMEERAKVITEEMAAGRFDYLKWFPDGALAPRFRAVSTLKTPPKTLAAYVEKTWLPRMVPPNVLKSRMLTYKKHWRCHIKPAFGSWPFPIETPALVDFRGKLTASKSDGGKGLKMVTARNVIDSTFRAIYRDARRVDRIVSNDPFADIGWPRKITPKPDPFTAEERDQILDYFWRKKRNYHPFVYTMFFVGLRPSEAIGLRWGCVDLRRGMLTIEKSRSYGEDNPTKTARAERTIRARDEVIDEMRESYKLRATEADFAFTSEGANPIDEDRFAENHWHPTLRALEIRPRSFYKTRHTFISLSLESGTVKSVKALADYCGTSVEMIEKHYAGKMPASSAEELAGLGGAAPATPRRLKRAS